MEDKNPIDTFLAAVRKHIEQLHKLDQQVLKPQALDKYPFKDIISFYQKQLIPKLTQRSKRSKIFNDILMTLMPKFLIINYKIQIFNKSLQPQLNVSVLQSPEDLQLSQNSTLQTALRIPIQFMQNTMLQTIKQCIAQNMRKNQVIQGEALLRFITLFQKFIAQQKNTELSLPIEQYQQKIRSLQYPDVENMKCRLTVKFIFRFLFIAKLRLRVKKANKHIHQRKMRIQQLIQGEKKYINGLVEYIEYVKNPICKLDILTDIEKKKLFSTIQTILAFHRIFEQQLSQRFQKYFKYQTYGDLIKKNIPFFKIYTDYIEYADEAQALLLKLQQTNQQVKAICAKFMQQKQKKASDQLKQPTFRIARYGMIISQIIKNTNPIHPDYPLLKLAYKQVTSNLSKINQTVDLIARRTKLHQLDQQFGTQQKPIFTKQRSFIEQFHMRLISDDKMDPVTLFIFNDMVLMIDQNRRILQWIPIDSKFYVRREQDNKTYRNMIKIHSNGFLTFSAGNEDRHYAKADSIYKILKGLSKSNIFDVDKMVYVHVIGTQEINSSTFNKYTQYIAQIKYMGLRKFSRLRFSKMKVFVSKMQQFYKNDLGISLDESLKDSWFYNYNSKTIQDRKRTIEQILQKMLNNQIIKHDPDFILNDLGIQPSFLRLSVPTKLKKQHSANDEPPSPLLFRDKSQQRQVKEAETILCATEIKLGRDSYHDLQFINKKVAQSDRITIYIHTMVGEQPTPVRITDLYTVQDVCYQLSNLLQLKTNRDFRLFHQVGKKQLRVLDHDQKIMKLFNYTKKQTGTGSSILNILGAVKSLIVSETVPKLIFKKYYFLPKDIERSECKKDVTRLRLIVYQIFSQIKDMKYNLSFQDYLLYLAIMIYIQYDGEIPQQTQISYVKKIIPQKIFKIKNQTQQYWLNQCRPHLQWLRQQISKIIEHNKQKVKNKRIRYDSVIHFGHRHICSQLAITKIRENAIYGSNMFYVQVSKQTYQKFVKQGKNPAYNMWLGIKVDSFMLMSPSTKQIILQVQLKQIDRIVVETEGVIFKLQSLALCQYSLNTYQSFQISELVKYYKCLAETIDQLDKNQSLLHKAREYKKQLEAYRSSYQKAERETMAAQNFKGERISIALNQQ